MESVSLIRLAWRNIALFWVKNSILAPFLFSVLGTHLLMLFIDNNTLLGIITIVGIIITTTIVLSILARQEVRIMKKELADSGVMEELTEVIMAEARKHAEGAEQNGSVKEDKKEGKCRTCNCTFEPWVIAAMGKTEVKTTTICQECFFKEQKKQHDELFGRTDKHG